MPAGMQTAMKIMPLFFGFISWGLPSGLVLYFATSNSFRIGQQAVMFSLDGKHEAEKAANGAAGVTDVQSRPVVDTGDSNDASAPPVAGPNPNASKKRKKRRRK